MENSPLALWPSQEGRGHLFSVCVLKSLASQSLGFFTTETSTKLHEAQHNN